MTQMDLYPGINDRPVTLHKYLYAGNDPENMVDPSDYFFGAYFGGAIYGAIAETNVLKVVPFSSVN